MATDNLGSGEILDLGNRNHFEIPQLRGQKGKWLVEQPHLPKSDVFKEVSLMILPITLEECHPFLRNGKGLINFRKKTVYFPNANGAARWRKIKDDQLFIDIEISLEALNRAQNLHPTTNWHIPAIGIMLHEILETDYNLKSLDLKLKVPKFVPPDPNYFKADHELIPDARAERIIERVLGAGYHYTPDRFLVLDRHRSFGD